MKKPQDLDKFAFFIHNKGQMYFIKQDKPFGSYYFPLAMPSDKKVIWIANYELERTHWKTLNTENERCDETDSEANTTKCITRYIEQSVGCSMGYHGTDPKLER